MGYYIDFKSLSIDDFQSKLAAADLLPSRCLLKEKLTERFDCFRQKEIRNVYELQQTLKKKSKIEEFARTGIFDENYLIVLLREINSMQPKPCKIEEFRGISPETVACLAKSGVLTTAQLFDRVKTVLARKELSQEAGIPETEILLLAHLADLNRIRWVGATFARMLYDSGYCSASDLAWADYNQLHHQINQLNKKQNLFKGAIGLHDMKLCVEAAGEVSSEIEW
ncbi:MAG: DUF4332 domain-containing protein [Prolixibacteraceae bacterium]|jgi:hypothetical protein|nr:DUF4332 domain-containing protein [Prolixibacteraceae bacterium]